MTFDINLQHKEFPVFHQDLENYFRSFAGPHYVGMSVDYDVSAHFSQDPGEEIHNRIVGYWDSVSLQTEADKIFIASKSDRAVAMATQQIPFQSWDQMIPAERKIMLKQDLSPQDKDNLVAKYPNA